MTWEFTSRQRLESSKSKKRQRNSPHLFSSRSPLATVSLRSRKERQRLAVGLRRQQTSQNPREAKLGRHEVELGRRHSKLTCVYRRTGRPKGSPVLDQDTESWDLILAANERQVLG